MIFKAIRSATLARVLIIFGLLTVLVPTFSVLGNQPVANADVQCAKKTHTSFADFYVPTNATAVYSFKPIPTAGVNLIGSSVILESSLDPYTNNNAEVSYSVSGGKYYTQGAYYNSAQNEPYNGFATLNYC